jgi:hypothetical protein
MATIDDAIFAEANRRATKKKTAFPTVVAACYDRRISRIVLALDSGLDLSFPPHAAQGLENARPCDLDVIEISPSGFGVHFPKLDVDLYLPALVEGFLGSRRWIAAQNGKIGGKVASAAKRQAAQRNGKLGGRPRKIAKVKGVEHS